MPALSITLAAAQAIAGAHMQSPTIVHRVNDELVIEARSATFFREDPSQPLPSKMEFKDGVKATMGADVLTANSLTLYPTELRGEAHGTVKLVAPEGSISAQDLEFSYSPTAKWVKATQIEAEVGGIKMQAARAETIPGDPPTFVLYDVYATPCGKETTPLIAARSPKLEFTPGKKGVLSKPRLFFLGKPIITLPDRRFNLDPRVSGWQLPSLDVGSDGIGASWNSSVLLNEQTAVSGSARAVPRDPFRFDLYVTKSFAEPQSASDLITPRSDLGERFGNGFFDNIRVASPFKEDQNIGERRLTLSLGTSWNHGTVNDDSSDRYSKAVEAIYEQGGKLGGLGYQTSLRAHSIRLDEGEFHERVVAQGSLTSGSIPIVPKLYARARVDAAAFMGGESFGWVRSEIGLVATPAPWLMVGGAFVSGHEEGTPLFPADELRSTRATHLRLDFKSGRTEFGVLWKKEHDNHRELIEYYANQAIGCLELFVMFRDEPSRSQFGVRLRLDDFIEPLKSRKVNRRKELVPVDPRIGPASGFAEPPTAEPHVHP